MAGSCCSTCAGALSIVGVAAMIGAAHSMLAKPIHLTLDEESAEAAPANPVEGEPQTPIGVVTGETELERVKRLYDEFAVFLDARPLYQYEQGHIPNALWMPADRVMDNGMLIFNIETEAGSFDEQVVIYCGGGDCDASENLAILLKQGGFTNLLIFHEGYPAWVAAGFGTQVGAPLEIEP